MVVVVAALLSLAATSLKPLQDENVKQESWQNILKSINVDVTRAESKEAYETYITEELVIKNGQVVEGTEPIEIVLADEIKKPLEERKNPLYIANKDGETFYIIPLRGGGLWGPIWGFLSLKKDASTIYGANFDHKSETPGLGAEINTASFYDQFKNKNILSESGSFTSVTVKKGGGSGAYEVDGISGGTVTSDGVTDMLKNCLAGYVDYLKARSPKHDDDLPVEEIDVDDQIDIPTGGESEEEVV